MMIPPTRPFCSGCSHTCNDIIRPPINCCSVEYTRTRLDDADVDDDDDGDDDDAVEMLAVGRVGRDGAGCDGGRGVRDEHERALPAVRLLSLVLPLPLVVCSLGNVCGLSVALPLILPTYRIFELGSGGGVASGTVGET